MIFSAKYTKDSLVIESIARGMIYLDHMAYRQHSTDLVYKEDRDILVNTTKFCQELPIKPTWFNMENAIGLDMYSFDIDDEKPIARIVGNRLIGLGTIDKTLECADGRFTCLDDETVLSMGLLLCVDDLFSCPDAYFTSTNAEYEPLVGVLMCSDGMFQCSNGYFVCIDGTEFQCLDNRRVQFVYNRLNIDNLLVDAKVASFLSLMKEDFQASYAYLRMSEALLGLAMESDTEQEKPQTNRLPEAVQTIFKL